jgi:predicted DNA-binding transcriptional regulator YafY
MPSQPNRNDKSKYSPFKSEFIRQSKIHRWLKSGERMNCDTLAGIVRGIKPNRFTILRDIKTLRNHYKMPVKYDRTNKVYFYEDIHAVPNALNASTLSATEAEALTMARNTLIQYGGSAMADRLDRALDKVGAFENHNQTNESKSMSVMVVGAATTTPSDASNLDIVKRAIDQCRTIKFLYCKLDETKPSVKNAHPHHCFLSKGRWYMLAYCLKAKEIRMYRLDRVSRLEIKPETFQRQPDFNPKDHMGRGIGVIKGKGSYNIKIKFDRRAAQVMGKTVWDESQKVSKLKDGAIEMTMHLTDLLEVTNWLLSWGDHAKVITPLELQNKVKEAAKAVVDLYK